MRKLFKKWCSSKQWKQYLIEQQQHSKKKVDYTEEEWQQILQRQRNSLSYKNRKKKVDYTEEEWQQILQRQRNSLSYKLRKRKNKIDYTEEEWNSRLQYQYNWVTQNYERALEQGRRGSAKYKAWKNNTQINDLTLEDWQRCLEICYYECHYCGSKKRLEMDHMQPLSRGGNHTFVNIIVACRSCNASKGNKTYFEYMRWLGFEGVG